MQNINILKSLAQSTFDSVEGYRKAIDKAESPALKSALERRLNSREQTLSKLNSVLDINGEDRITSASMTGKAHHAFLSIADAFENGNEAAVERVEEGEDYLAEQFRDVLKDESWDASVRTIVQQAAREVFEAERFSDMLETQYS